jgi:uncharacterized protein YukE
MVNFNITPQQISASAQRVGESLQRFVQSENQIYAATDGLRVQFQGQASSTFNERINAYRSDFRAVENTVREFTQFLQQYAAEASRKENDLTQRAGSLSTGSR